jgi:hypothetical protein
MEEPGEGVEGVGDSERHNRVTGHQQKRTLTLLLRRNDTQRVVVDVCKLDGDLDILRLLNGVFFSGHTDATVRYACDATARGCLPLSCPRIGSLQRTVGSPRRQAGACCQQAALHREHCACNIVSSVAETLSGKQPSLRLSADCGHCGQCGVTADTAESVRCCTPQVLRAVCCARVAEYARESGVDLRV